jgi:hypothetical protein
MGDNALRCLEAAWDRFDLCAAPFGNDRSLREADAGVSMPGFAAAQGMAREWKSSETATTAGSVPPGS